MATDQSSQLPAIFLSHSGDDKGFAWNLYRELLDVNHEPFFDQDAGVDVLPQGIHFPARILEACRACKLAIVVLSPNYVKSLWPMLELQQFFFHDPRPLYVVPLFYKLSPADLSNEVNLTQWHSGWKDKEALWKDKLQGMHMAQSGMSTPSLDSQPPTLDIRLWAEALERLRSQSGHVVPNNKDERAYIRAIVSNVCRMLHPPLRSVLSRGGNNVYQGAERIQQTIHGLFEQRQRVHDKHAESSRKMPLTVGLYGVGGSGKTTVCKFMVSFYDKDYPGRSCFLQFPSDNEEQLLLKSFKDFLSEHVYVDEEKLRKINNVDQAKPYLEKFFKRYPMFLVIDNIWDWALFQAKEILEMDYMPGSRLLVTARSEGVLRKLKASFYDNDALTRRRFGMKIRHVPSISETEAIEALKAYSFSASRGLANAEDQLSRLAKTCFFGAQCHPALLRALGGKLHSDGSSTKRSQALETVISRMESRKISGDEIEEIMIVLRASYNALNPKLRDFLLMLGTCVPKKYLGEKGWSKAIEWLSMVYECGSHSIEDIRAQMDDLEYHGLIKKGEGTVIIHDLLMMMIEKIVQEKENVPKRYFLEGDVTILSQSKWRGLKYVYGFGKEAGRMKVFSLDWYVRKGLRKGIANVLDDNKYVLDLEVLRLSNMSPRTSTGIFILNYVRHLRFLELHMVDGVEMVRGWEGAPNLVSVVLSKCEDLQEIEAMVKALTSLRKIRFSRLSKWKNTMDLSKLYYCTALERCTMPANPLMCSFPSLTLSKLREVDLSDCKGLQTMEGSECCLTALEELSLTGCVSLESIPDLKQLVKLRSLKLKGCVALKQVKVGEATLTSLEYLSLEYGCTQFFIGTSSSAPLAMSAFTNLKTLDAQGTEEGSSSSAGGEQPLEARMLKLPASLEKLVLSGFKGAREMPDLSGLVNLKRLGLEGWPTSVTSSLGHLSKKLESVTISP